MTPEAFTRWLADMIWTERASTEAECGALLGVSANTIVTMKRHGANRRTALACAALLKGIAAYE